MTYTASTTLLGDVLLSDKETASLLGISRTTVWRHVSCGLIPQPIKIGRRTKFPKSEILGVIDAAKRNRAR